MRYDCAVCSRATHPSARPVVVRLISLEIALAAYVCSSTCLLRHILSTGYIWLPSKQRFARAARCVFFLVNGYHSTLVLFLFLGVRISLRSGDIQFDLSSRSYQIILDYRGRSRLSYVLFLTRRGVPVCIRCLARGARRSRTNMRRRHRQVHLASNIRSRV